MSMHPFIVAMAAGEDWPVVFGPDRPAEARRLVGILRANKPCDAELLRNALAPTTTSRTRVEGDRRGSEFVRAAYYEHASVTP